MVLAGPGCAWLGPGYLRVCLSEAPMPKPSRVPLVAALAFGGLAVLASACALAGPTPDQRARGEAAFADVARLLRHPRCLNCHTVTDYPRVGDDRRPHPQNVRRGTKDHGAPGLHCSTCHQDANQEYSRVPGAPHWGLAPLSMGWEGLDDHDLAEALKDRAKNGNRSLDDLRHHMADDPLVGWAWQPGADRTPPPMTRAEAVAAFDRWIENGAVTPSPGTTSN